MSTVSPGERAHPFVSLAVPVCDEEEVPPAVFVDDGSRDGAITAGLDHAGGDVVHARRVSRVPGWTSLVILNVLVCLGLVGDYVARTFQEIKGRPLYVVQRRLGTGPPPDERR